MFLRILTVGAAAIVLLASAPAAAVAPFAFDSTPGRLPKTVVPREYTIALVPDAGAKRFTGTESVALDVRTATDRIELNTLDLTIAKATLDGRPLTVRTQNEKQLTTFALPAPVRAGAHVLAIQYAGTIGESPAGLFVQDYRRRDGTTARMLSTQFEATDARRMFPSWDEPAFRATFQLTVTLPAGWTAVSNTPAVARRMHGSVATTTFARTPRMPSYLVVLSAGDLASIGGVGPDGVKQNVWAVRGSEEQGRYTLESAEQILAYYDDYFGVKFPLPKLDHIAVPGGFGGAMENWGGITYNQDIILHPPSATVGQREEGFSVVAHEMAHQWNGDLVTMGWWDDIWLNESFASWMAAKATEHFNPSWQWAQREDASKESAMNADARLAAHAIQQHVTDELQAGASFDSEITYDKGQAFLRMLEAYLGPQTFQAGVRAYMQAHKYSNATTADLWNSLSGASRKDVAALASAWTEQPGFPLVSVTSACDASSGKRTVTLAQHRFLLEGDDPANELWNIPVAIASGASDAPSYVVLATASQSGIPAGRCGEPLRVNAGNVGYYRVAYDAPTFEANRRAFGALPAADKIAMLDDQWALARSGRAPLTAYLGLARSMGSERDARAWQQIVGALAELERDARGTPDHDAVAAYARALVRPLAAALTWDAAPGESPALVDLRSTVLDALGDWNDPATVAEARRRFAALQAPNATATPEEQRLVLAIVATNADAATWDRIHTLATSATDPVVARRYLAALMSVRDPQLAQRALALTLSDEIPPQEFGLRARYVGTVANWNPQAAWAFYQANSEKLRRKQSSFEAMLGIARGVAATYWRAASPDELNAWLTAKLPPQAAPYIARSIARARFDIAASKRLDEQMHAIASGPATGDVTTR